MSDVNIERDGAILSIELACPEKSNPLTADAVESMLEALTGTASKDLVLAVFTGRGKNLCSGFDLSDIERASDADLLYRIVRIETLLQAIFHAPFVTLALAQGNVVGAGVDLVCACALRTATPEAVFRMPGWRFGVALGTHRLVHRVGADVARQLLLPCKRFDAKYALEVGFLQNTAPVDDWPRTKSEAGELSSFLSAESVSELLLMTRPDTRSEDMAALVRSAGRPGLQKRILDYIRSMKKTRVA